ncbi:MAG TPA: STAS domain-containing protein [Chondromyces sp.]|nr:STAS domain-containing protein [Chondromyces sp.]
MNRALYAYIKKNLNKLTENWMQNAGEMSRTESSDGKANLNKKVNQENVDFIQWMAEIFVEPEKAESNLRQWATTVAKERVMDDVSLYEIIHQFKEFRGVFLGEIEKFTIDTENVSIQDFFGWNRVVNKAFDDIIEIFSNLYYEFSIERLKAQQEMINELSSPVILIKPGIGVLPLIGDIDTQRAQIILESSLHQCSQKQVRRLFIDLSAVPIMDTMVAHQIFQVIRSLKLIGVQAVLSGVRPEVAQTAVQLGIDFSGVVVEANLARALAKLEDS